MTTTTVILALGLAFAAFWTWKQKRPALLLLPPGPKPWPIIGNLLDLPKEKDWITYKQLAHIYGRWTEINPHLFFFFHSYFFPRAYLWLGDVVCLKAFNTHIIVLNSAKAIGDLLEGRSAIYSDRPVKPVFELSDSLTVSCIP